MEPILLDVPEEILTDRLRLRVPRIGDGAKTAEAVIASRAELQVFMPWATDNYSVDDGEMWARRAFSNFILRQQLHFLITDKATGDYFGGIGAHRIDWKVRLCEIGYWLRTDQWGHGYMTEALKAITEMFGTIGLRRIEVRCDERNARSAAVARRAGFHHDGTLPATALDGKGIPRNGMVFSRIHDVPVEELPASNDAAKSIKST